MNGNNGGGISVKNELYRDFNFIATTYSWRDEKVERLFQD
jgi:hypothetical protein